MKTTNIETREVLEAAYVKRSEGRGRMLTHAAVVDGNGYATEVLCGRVALACLADGGAGDKNAPPTCPRCIAAMKRTRAANK